MSLTSRTVWHVLAVRVKALAVDHCPVLERYQNQNMLHHYNHPTKVMRTSLFSSYYRHCTTVITSSAGSLLTRVTAPLSSSLSLQLWTLGHWLWITQHIRQWCLCSRRLSVCQRPKHLSSAFSAMEKGYCSHVMHGCEIRCSLTWCISNAISICVIMNDNDLTFCAIFIEYLQYYLNTTYKGLWIWHRTSYPWSWPWESSLWQCVLDFNTGCQSLRK